MTQPPAHLPLRGLAALALLLAAGCSGVEGVERPEYPAELRGEIPSFSEPLSLQDDYWTETLGDYLAPEELHSYWIQPHEKRFVTYGERWLEFCLRDDLLKERRWPLPDEALERFRAQPNFDAARRILIATPETENAETGNK